MGRAHVQKECSCWVSYYFLLFHPPGRSSSSHELLSGRAARSSMRLPAWPRCLLAAACSLGQSIANRLSGRSCKHTGRRSTSAQGPQRKQASTSHLLIARVVAAHAAARPCHRSPVPEKLTSARHDRGVGRPSFAARHDAIPYQIEHSKTRHAQEKPCTAQVMHRARHARTSESIDPIDTY